MSTAIEWTDETKACSRCTAVLPRSAFAKDGTRPDGLTYWCRDCRNARGRRNHRSRATGRRPGPPRKPERTGDRRQARRTVNHEVEVGRLPHPNSVPCTDCQHVWQEGERRHEYDHHHGYGVGHHQCVEAVCTTCHHDRERARA